MRLHHVQVSCPAGGEAAARRFYVDGLGLSEVEKPEPLRARGGAWFRAYDGAGVSAEVHVGVENDFAPARKAHPALLLDDVAELEAVVRALRGAGHVVDCDDQHTFPGYLRVHAWDPHGNRVELLAPA